MGGAIVAIKDAHADAEAANEFGEKSLFGAFIAEGLGRKAKGFYGGGDSCVFGMLSYFSTH